MSKPERKIKDCLTKFKALCREKSISVTHQRIEIFREICTSTDHPDVNMVFARVSKRIPSISLDTVYRTLKMLEDWGMICRVRSQEHRGRFDANMQPHHHFTCSRCGIIRDFYSDKLDAYIPPREIKALGDVSSVHIELQGVCHACQNDESSVNNKK